MSRRQPWYKRHAADSLRQHHVLSLEERGALITIQDLLHDMGEPLEIDDRALANMLGVRIDKCRRIVNALIEKSSLYRDDNGRLMDDKHALIDELIEDKRPVNGQLIAHSGEKTSANSTAPKRGKKKEGRDTLDLSANAETSNDGDTVIDPKKLAFDSGILTREPSNMRSSLSRGFRQ